MPENYIPSDGLCDQDLLGTIAIRNPIERLQSHYDHINLVCYRKHGKREDVNNPCHRMFRNKHNDVNRKYNVSFTTKAFDFVTDNYLTRTLNGQEVFGLPFGMDGKGEEYFAIAMETLVRFDWILITDSDYDQGHEENDLILTQGLGLTSGLPLKRVSARHKLTNVDKYEFLPDDLSYLQDLNDKDIRLWREAHRLHDLDVESLRQLAKYNETLSYMYPKANSTGRCCGHLCQ